jgi:iron complex transport system permease protein
VSRYNLVAVSLLAALVVLAYASLALGALGDPPSNVLSALAGGDDRFTVVRLRLPRLVLGILVGACLGVAGTIFQTLLANPLASPDLIGVSQGASAAAAGAILLAGLSGPAVSLVAFVGALVVAAIITMLSWRNGVSSYRFVLIGIGLAFLVQAFLGYLLTRADLKEAQGALVWLVGSIGTAGWEEIGITAVIAGVLAVGMVPLAPTLRMLQLGDQTATGLGVPVTRSRALLTLVAVGFAAIAVAVAGPVLFVAFVAGPIARRVTRSPDAALVASALVGAVVVVAADFLGQRALGDVRVPVGVVTSLVGAPYLLWLLARDNRSRGTA